MCRPPVMHQRSAPLHCLRMVKRLSRHDSLYKTVDSVEHLRGNSAGLNSRDSAAHYGLGGSLPTEAQASFPTDAKEREKAKRKADKEAGVDKQVQRRKKVMEDHYDDCGDDMSSLHDVDTHRWACMF